MGDVRIMHAYPPPKDVAPAEATRAVGTLLRWFWCKVRNHVRYGLPWMGLCAYLALKLWSANEASSLNARPVSGAGDAQGTHVVQRPVLTGPDTLIGVWSMPHPPHTVLDFAADGTVISRTALKEHKGSYKVNGATISIHFEQPPLFWDGKQLPNRFAISGDELLLLNTQDKFTNAKQSADCKTYCFKRSTAAGVRPVAP
jgi:hypothetical protein